MPSRILRDAVNREVRNTCFSHSVVSKSNAVRPQLNRAPNVALEEREVAVVAKARVDLEVVICMVQVDEGERLYIYIF